MNTGGPLKLKLGSPFSDGMVIQRDMPVSVWGVGPDGETVNIQFQGTQAAANISGGKWTAALPPQCAGGPCRLVIRCAGEECVVDDILVGEVFLCSGQSNMEVPISFLNTKAEILPQAPNHQVRVFRQNQNPAATAAEGCLEGRWEHSTPDNAPEQPAVPLMFGLRLQRQLGVPVGVIVAAVGGSGVTGWLPPSSFNTREDLRQHWATYPWMQTDYDAIYAEWTAARRAMDEENARRTAEKVEPLPWTKYLFFGPRGPKCMAQPAGLYNGMIHPLARMALS